MDLSHSENRKILLTDGNYKHTWTVARSLGQAGFEVDVIGGKRSIASKSKYVRNSILSNFDGSGGILRSFLSILEGNRYAAILGIGAKSVKFLSDYRAEISKFSNLILPSAESLEICLVKDRTLNLARALDIGTPQSIRIGSVKELQSAVSLISPPFIIKSALEFEKSISTLYFDSTDELFGERNQDIYLDESFDFLLQKRIYGTAEAFFAIYNLGVLEAYFMHERIRENPPSGGPSTRARSIFKFDLYEKGKSLLDSLNWHGVAMVEFKRTPEGELFLMEINPKFWGSLDLAISAGVDFPLYAAKIALGQSVPAFTGYSKSKEFQWPFDGDFAVAGRSPKFFISVISDLFNPKISKNLYLKDLSPTFHSIGNQVIKYFLSFSLLKPLNSLAHKINSSGLKLGILRWFTEFTGIPSLHFSKVENGIYFGGRLSKIGILYLRIRKIKVVLNLRAEFDDEKLGLKGFKYSHVPIEEFQGASISQLLEAIQIIHAGSRNGERIYVHCAEGIGRAPNIVAGYLISSGLTVDQAISRLKKVRPFIQLNDYQIISLENLSLHYGRTNFSK